MSAAGRYLTLLPFLLLALGLLATWFGWRLAETAVEARAAVQFRQEADATAGAIVERLRTYELLLRGAAGLFFASDTVSRSEFRTYLEILQIQNDYPGIQGLGYAEVVRPDELEDHEARIRAAGFPAYRVHPRGNRDLLAVIVYLEPFDPGERAVLGFDMYADPVRRVAMARARDTGDAAISGLVRLLQDGDEDNQAAFLMYLPVYAAGRDPGTLSARRDALVGYVYAPFQVSDLMQGILRRDGAQVTFALYDGVAPDEATLLYRDGAPMAGTGHYRTDRIMEIAGRQWSARFAATPAFEARLRAGSIAPTIAGAGTAISLVLFVIALLTGRMASERRRSAEAIRVAEQKLHQAQKMESIGQLTGGIAHDFNNLLTVVIGNAEALVGRLPGDDRGRRLAEMILHAAQRGADLTARLLAIARRQALVPRATDVGAMLSGMEGLLRRSLGATVEITLERPDGLWPALVDPAQLESALLNLSINARDAMPGGGQLRISLHNLKIEGDRDLEGETADLPPGDYVRIAVADTGSGMKPDILARAFDPFFTTKALGQGSGLGLSMVFGFAKQSGGHAAIESRPGAGTTVTLYLPRSPEPAAAPTSQGPRLTSPHGTEKVLLVEDDDLVRVNATAQLQQLGYTVTVASNGQDGLSALEQDAGIALLFTDLVMPGGLDGRQLAEAARRLRPGLPVLFTTGYAHHVAPEELPGTGPVGLLPKPYLSQDLALQVRTVLDAA